MFVHQSSQSSLDTSLTINNCKIKIYLYRKETDRNQYLLPSSCHPMATSTSISFFLSLEIIKKSYNKKKIDKILEELKTLLLARNYPEKLVDCYN